jgi:hypothetical protein
MMEQLVVVSLQEGGLEGLAFLAALGASEPNVRLLLENTNLLDSTVSGLSLEDPQHFQTRASTSMVLRAMDNFPIGRRGPAWRFVGFNLYLVGPKKKSNNKGTARTRIKNCQERSFGRSSQHCGYSR